MTPQELADHLSLIARTLVEVNTKLDALPRMQEDVLELKRGMLMVRGWMDGQEEITSQHSKRMTDILHEVEALDRRLDASLDKLGHIGLYVVDVGTKLGGVIELSKSAYDVAEETKGMVKELRDIIVPENVRGGEDVSEQAAAKQ